MFDFTEVSFPIEYRKVPYSHRKFKELKKLYKTVPVEEVAQTPRLPASTLLYYIRS